MIGLYALESNLEMGAFAEGLGLPFTYRNHNYFLPNETENFDLVVVTGLRGKGKDIRDAYNALGVPCIVIDYGYMNRVFGVDTWNTGHWQVGLNRLGWIPPFSCPDDRFNSLGVQLKKPHEGDYILVCGQHVGDPSHGLDAAGISSWATKAIAELKGDKPVLWRPHPDSPDVVAEGYDGISSGAIEWDKVHAVRCINSNIGHEAIINGVQAICDDAPYKDITDRKDYFSRLAYAQWTLEEMRQGKAWEFISNSIERLKNEANYNL